MDYLCGAFQMCGSESERVKDSNPEKTRHVAVHVYSTMPRRGLCEFSLVFVFSSSFSLTQVHPQVGGTMLATALVAFTRSNPRL